jgi:hypothetical protein
LVSTGTRSVLGGRGFADLVRKARDEIQVLRACLWSSDSSVGKLERDGYYLAELRCQHVLALSTQPILSLFSQVSRAPGNVVARGASWGSGRKDSGRKDSGSEAIRQ